MRDKFALALLLAATGLALAQGIGKTLTISVPIVGPIACRDQYAGGCDPAGGLVQVELRRPGGPSLIGVVVPCSETGVWSTPISLVPLDVGPEDIEVKATQGPQTAYRVYRLAVNCKPPVISRVALAESGEPPLAQ